MTHMYGIAITYGFVSLLLLGGFAYFTIKITSQMKVGSLSKLIALLIALILVCSTFFSGIIKFIN